MANRYAISAGNWSNPAIWDGGVSVPTSGDAVRANGFQVTIDQDVTVASIRTDASAPAVVGGRFNILSLPGGGRTINANIYSAATYTCLMINTVMTGTLTINGDVEFTGGSSDTQVIYLGTGAAITLNVNGTLTCGSNSGLANNTACIYIFGAATVIFTGSMVGGSGISAGHVRCIYQLNGWCIVNGNVSGSFVGSGGSTTITISAGNLTINGNVLPGSSGTTISQSAGTLTINGDVGNGAGAGATLTVSGGTLNVNGDVTSTPAGVVIALSGTPTVDINGTVETSSNGPAIQGYSMTGGIVRFRGGPLIDGDNGRAAAVVPIAIFAKQPAKTSIRIRGDAGFPVIGGSITLANFEDNGLPAPSDVRVGVLYGPDDTLVGTRYSALTTEDVWSYPVEDADIPGSMGARLRDVATVASTGAQIAAAMTD